jgi:hypothetical protein
VPSKPTNTARARDSYARIKGRQLDPQRPTRLEAVLPIAVVEVSAVDGAHDDKVDGWEHMARVRVELFREAFSHLYHTQCTSS